MCPVAERDFFIERLQLRQRGTPRRLFRSACKRATTLTVKPDADNEGTEKSNSDLKQCRIDKTACLPDHKQGGNCFLHCQSSADQYVPLTDLHDNHCVFMEQVGFPHRGFSKSRKI